MITSNRTFGIEIEMGVAKSANVAKLRDLVPYEWRFDDDGSIRNVVPNPVELVSPILRGESGERAITEVCNHAKDLGFDADHVSCGLHVHLGAKEFKSKKELLVLSNKEMDEFVSSKNNVKNIVRAAYATKSAVQTVMRKSPESKLLNSNYRSIGERVLSGGWGSGVNEIGARRVIYMKREQINIHGTAIDLSIVDKVDYDYYSAELDKLHKKIYANQALLEKIDPKKNPDEYMRAQFKFTDARTSLIEMFEAGLSEKVRKTGGKYIVEVISNESFIKLRNVFLAYLIFDDVFSSMLPSDRRDGNMYCQRLSESFTVEELMNCTTHEEFEKMWYKTSDPRVVRQEKSTHYSDSRYHNVNFHSLYNRHGTIEIRSHGSTTNPRRVILWTALHQLVLDSVVDGRLNEDNMLDLHFTSADTKRRAEVFLELTRATVEIRKYMQRLMGHFSGITINV